MAHEYRPMEQNRKSINRPNYIYKYIKQQKKPKRAAKINEKRQTFK